jgi:hypothetical protein
MKKFAYAFDTIAPHKSWSAVTSLIELDNGRTLRDWEIYFGSRVLFVSWLVK